MLHIIIKLLLTMRTYKKIEPSPLVLITMGSCKYIPLLIIFITLSFLDWAPAVLYEEEAAGNKYTAKEDTQIFLKEIESLGEGYGTNWIVMPDGNNTAQFAVMQKDRSIFSIRTGKKFTFEGVADQVTFVFYKTKLEDNIKFKWNDIHNINFNITKPTKFICHGWMADYDSTVIKETADAYLAEENINVIGVDWSPISRDFFYPNSAMATKTVGQVVGYVIDLLVKERSARYSDFHVIGHSLGAHIAGFAGNATQQKISRITGLDPALPGFQLVTGPEGRLDKSDAEFVDVIHTCSGVLGLSVPIGHVDFYPNGGSVFQPGCAGHTITHGPQACSHSRAHQFFAESINKTADFEAVKCQNWDEFKHNNCEKVFSVMGENISRDTSPGLYYLKTNRESPFSKGPEGIKY